MIKINNKQPKCEPVACDQGHYGFYWHDPECVSGENPCSIKVYMEHGGQRGGSSIVNNSGGGERLSPYSIDTTAVPIPQVQTVKVACGPIAVGDTVSDVLHTWDCQIGKDPCKDKLHIPPIPEVSPELKESLKKFLDDRLPTLSDLVEMVKALEKRVTTLESETVRVDPNVDLVHPFED